MKDGWKEVKLGELVTLKNGYSFKSETYEDNGKYNIITIKNVTGSRYISTTNCATISELPGNIKQHQKLKSGDILISMTGNVGRISMVNTPNCLLNQRVGLLEVKSGIVIDHEFLFQLLNSKAFESEMISRGHGAAQPNIGKDDIESYVLAIPESIKEQKRIAKVLSDLGKLTDIHSSKLDVLSRMKAQLMSNKSGIIERERQKSEQLQQTESKIIDIKSRLPQKMQTLVNNLEETQKIIDIITYVGEDNIYERERERVYCMTSLGKQAS